MSTMMVHNFKASHCEVLKAFHSARVHLVTYEQRDGAVQYKVAVQHGGEEWCVWRRYSAFRALHERLDDAVAFPPKVMLCRGRHLASRAAQLEAWLGAVASRARTAPEWALVADFLEVGRHSGFSEASTCSSPRNHEVEFELSFEEPADLPEPEPELTPFQKRRAELRRQQAAAAAAPAMDKETAAALCRAQVLAAQANEESGAVLEAADEPATSLRALRYKATFGEALH